MAIKKQFLKTKPECKVTFSVSAEEANGAASVVLLGDFNEWDPSVMVMKKQKNDEFSITVSLPTGGECKFRYLVDGERWINDCEADSYEYCQFADAENAVLFL